MPQINNGESTKYWELKRDRKIYRVASEELLRKIQFENRFAEGDQIRAMPGGTWQPISAFDWVGLGAQTHAILAPPTEVPSHRPHWWQESSTASPTLNMHSGITQRLRVGLAIAATGVALLLWFAFSSNRWQTPKVTIDNKSGVNSEQSSYLEAPAISPSDSSASAGSESAPQSDAGATMFVDEPAVESPTLVQQQSSSSGSQEFQNTGPTQSVEMSIDVAEVLRLAVDKPPAMLGNEMADGEDATNLAPADANEIVLEAPTSASKELEAKAELDRIYDTVVASIQASRKVSSTIFELRKNVFESKGRIEQFKTGIEDNKLLYSQGLNRIANVELEILRARDRLTLQAAGSSEAQMLRLRIQDLRAQETLLVETCQKAESTKNSLDRQLAAEQERFADLYKSLLAIFNKEQHLSSSENSTLDFFGDLPIEIHDRLLRESRNWYLSEPDFMLAYLVESAASLHLDNLDVPVRNLQFMREQMQLYSDEEREARSMALTRFEILGLAACGMAETKKGNTSDAQSFVRSAFQLKVPSSDLRFAAAFVAVNAKRSGDAILHIREGIRLEPSRSRGYALGLEFLSQQPKISDDVLVDFLVAFEKRADDSEKRTWPEHRYWLIAAETADRLGQYSKAKKYLEQADHPCLLRRLEEVSAKWSEAPEPPSD